MKCTYGIRKAVASVERLMRITNIAKEGGNNDKEMQSSKNVYDSETLVEFKNVCFAYDEMPVLKNVSFKILRGKKVAIVGQIGSGKTSIINLILGFYETQQGEILFNGKNINEYNYHELRNQICYVSQESILFNDTIYNNIALGNPNATAEEIINAAKLAHIHDYIMSTPDKYDTCVGDRGSNLSGGQKQCVTLARAFLKNAQIYIYDEATSAIDIEHENKIKHSIEKILKDKTVIYITHRIYDIKGFDDVLIINDGNIFSKNKENEVDSLIDKYIKMITL
jgi:ABC-type multidrug transport system fused ATPase/permease subunit